MINISASAAGWICSDLVHPHISLRLIEIDFLVLDLYIYIRSEIIAPQARFFLKPLIEI